MSDAETLQQALSGLERCVGHTADAGSYVFTTLNVVPPLPTETPRTKITDISSLRQFTELRSVRLSSQSITDLSAIASLPFLAELQADRNQLTTSIENCAARWCKEDQDERAWNSGDRAIGSVLEVVNLSYNQIIGPIGDHSKHRFLRRLDLSNNQLAPLGSGLSQLQRLVHLNVANNKIQSLQPTDLPPSLTSLDISGNALTSLTFLRQLVSVESINLDSNRIRVLETLSNCVQLRSVSARNNALDNFSSIVDLAGNEHLQELSIAGNPLCAVEFARLRVIAILQQLRTLDGEEVDATDKVKSEGNNNYYEQLLQTTNNYYNNYYNYNNYNN